MMCNGEWENHSFHGKNDEDQCNQNSRKFTRKLKYHVFLSIPLGRKFWTHKNVTRILMVNEKDWEKSIKFGRVKLFWNRKLIHGKNKQVCLESHSNNTGLNIAIFSDHRIICSLKQTARYSIHEKENLFIYHTSRNIWFKTAHSLTHFVWLKKVALRLTN